ncbi:MAG: 50S ribosomal protein L25 [Microgenomates group bacterium GW2011_GWC1_39_7b]|uniref:Large ribosomal subunit protein bL25 n=3 Tax=Candidatus Woeseibacteriota TaxID=1752722 RepID=A0A0G0P251_9BACT|nr:MAG: 50S ribosomal protein L25 [Candidatus Woesebacteria bacterium GW2011_GWB1_39_10]KKR26776.1 MAG: 50S ribosomal protein L25 [Microgenomates group bacterium GW2011_GWC1_39_7b]KKR72628.1 MAG: 50S ribosomal protein L25 [Candidatus Woesebacteria bacterium GW2011_GWA2_40_7]KKS91124.1 MAG: 50S ribosomal protein L25 [Candidatus Woesebacteria bacterium GW2011_GWA1_43_12]
MEKKILKAEERKIAGRKVKTLRQKGLIPGNISGKKIKSFAIQVVLKDFENIYKDVGETGLVELDVNGEKRSVLVHNVQKNAKTDEVVHIDFLQVDLKQKVEADVPVELTGESPAEKQAVGTVVQYINEIKVEALPTDLPEKFIVDTSGLAEVDQSILVKDLKVDRTKVDIKTGADEIVVKVEPPQKEEVVETPIVPVGAEGEVVAEGPEPAEGQKGGQQVEAPKEESKN